MTSSDWRKKLGQGTRALAQSFGRRPRPSSAPAPAPNPGVGTAPKTAGEALAEARASLLNGDAPAVLLLGYELLGSTATVAAGRTVLGLCHLTTSTPAQAWAEFVRLDDPAAIAAACPEYAIAGFGTDPAECAQRLAAAMTASPWPGSGYTALVVARHAFSVGHEDLARIICGIADAGGYGELTDYWASEFQRLRSWFSDGFRREPQAVVEADFRFGVIDYKQPDNSSRNVGDYIQTLASLGHLVRQQGLEFVGDEALTSAVQGLRDTVKPERERSEARARVHLVEVQRDGNVYQSLPEVTWAVMFGWYLHPTYSGGYNLPFNEALRPILVSFHLNKPDALTPEAIEYLRRYGPIGCRDWQTVALLSAAGVPAFFSGCITTTVDTVFARTGPDERTGVAYIDAQEAPEDEEQIEQSVGDIRPQPLVTNLALGRAWVERYHADYAEVVTTRLHSYLPARSVGCRVEFHPKNPSDPRFGGLIDIDDAAYEAIRQGILDKLSAVLAALASGASEQQVYERWRELCAPDVAAADAYLAEQKFATRALPMIALPSNLGEQVIVVNAPRASKTLARLLNSLAEHAADVPLLVVGAADPNSARDGLHVVPAPEGQDLTLAAVLDALPDGTRALLISADSVLTTDPSALLDAEPSRAGVAAELDVRRNRQSLSVLIRRISARQGDDWRAALRFATAAHRRCGHGAQVPDSRVCVLDVEALRACGWAELAAELIQGYDARFGEALAVVTRGEFAPLPAHSVTRVGVEAFDPAAIVVQGAAGARVPLRLLSSPATPAVSASLADMASTTPKVAIVVVSYNAVDYAHKMLKSLGTTRGVDYEVVVVDNNSGRRTKLFWTAARWLGRINRLALLDRNTFFAEGCNIGVAMAPRDATHVLLLNTDCEIKDPDWLARMLAAHEPGATGLHYITTGAWPRADGFCLLVDKDLWGSGLNEAYQWWWSVTGFEARLLREGHQVTAVKNYEDAVVHHWGKSGKAFKKAKSATTKPDVIRAWFEGHHVRVLDGLPPAP